MEIIKDYWTQIIFVLTCLGAFITFFRVTIVSVKCSLRNDILTIYEQCKKEREITQYQLQAILMSADLYFKLKGNSFVESIVEDIKKFKIID